MSIAIVGIGQHLRGDDALGPLMIEQLRPKLPKEIITVTVKGDMTHLLEIFSQHDTVILIDCLQLPDKNPGELVAIENPTPEQLENMAAISSHTFDLGALLRMAQALDKLPKKLIVLGIVGQDYTLGAPLSNIVSKQTPQFIELVLNELV